MKPLLTIIAVMISLNSFCQYINPQIVINQMQEAKRVQDVYRQHQKEIAQKYFDDRNRASSIKWTVIGYKNKNGWFKYNGDKFVISDFKNMVTISGHYKKREIFLVCTGCGVLGFHDNLKQEMDSLRKIDSIELIKPKQ